MSKKSRYQKKKHFFETMYDVEMKLKQLIIKLHKMEDGWIQRCEVRHCIEDTKNIKELLVSVKLIKEGYIFFNKKEKYFHPKAIDGYGE
jgi:hypothetical protein